MSLIRPKVKLDTVYDVGYVRIREGVVARTKNVSPWVLFDLDKDGEILGFELLGFELDLVEK